MQGFSRVAAAALALAVAVAASTGAAFADDSCFFTKTDVLGQLVPEAAEAAWLTGDSAEKASKAMPGQFAAATAPIIEMVGLVNTSGSVFALGFDGKGCAFVGDNVTLADFNAALAIAGHDPLPMPPKRPMQA